jgi:DNA modification methylase
VRPLPSPALLLFVSPMLTVRRLSLSQLESNPENPRTHGEANLGAIAASLTRFGQAEPLVIQRSSRRVIGGNGRLAVMKDLGWAEADVVELELDDQQATALGLALNRTASLAGYDTAALTRILEELEAKGDLQGTGYSAGDLEELVKELEAQSPREVDDPGPKAPPAIPVSRTSDLWCLGDHRLLCGDSTKLEDVQRVMASEQAALVATDPPYLIDYTGDRPLGAGKDWSEQFREIDIKDPAAFLRAAFECVLAVLAPHAAVYCWHASKRTGLLQATWNDLGILDHQQIVWVKPTAVFGRCHWHYRHEPCLMGWRQGSAPVHTGEHEFDSVWEVNWDGKARVVGNAHPTEKPAELFARPMRRHTRAGDVVFEPFSGSGSQLIAAERERRRCCAIELEPCFVDVAIERWQEATKKEATLEGDGRTFAELSKERLAS